MSLSTAICIATRNRCAELERTLAALARLDPAPDEILVMADGCSDGTEEMLRSAWPRVRVLRHETARGSIPSRNELAEAARSDLLFSFDDDSYPLAPDFLARARALFEQQPHLAVLSFAQRTDEFPETLTADDFGPSAFVGSFANSAAALRRSVFLALGGYPGFFFHMYEEPDLALRCAAAGWQVRYEPELVVRHHYTGSGRQELRIHHRHARNECWSALMRCPLPQLPVVVLFRLLRQLGYAASRGLGWVLREPAWWLVALRGACTALRARRPLSWRAYLGWMRLLRSPLTDEAAWRRTFGEPKP